MWSPSGLCARPRHNNDGRSSRQAERRRGPRRRTRLRSGRLGSMDNRFIVDCLIFDRSCEGVRLRLAGRVALPDLVRFFDDELRRLYVGRVVWQKGAEVGLWLPEGIDGGVTSGKAHAALSGKYYAVGHRT